MHTIRDTPLTEPFKPSFSPIYTPTGKEQCELDSYCSEMGTRVSSTNVSSFGSGKCSMKTPKLKRIANLRNNSQDFALPVSPSCGEPMKMINRESQEDRDMIALHMETEDS